MKKHRSLLATATRYSLIEHSRNRFALVLVAVFLPLWTVLAYVTVADAKARMRLRATDGWLTVPGNELTEISGVMNAVTLITGFLMFAATFAGTGFDRRLAMAGYPRLHLVLAKITALAVASAAVAGYATAVTCLIWTPRQPTLLAVALFGAAMTYGVLGVGFGAMFHREVEGMFAIVMTSIIDQVLQNPLMSSGPDSSAIAFLPSYGAMQAATAAGFSTAAASRYVLIQLAWFTGAVLIGLLVFWHRTRNTLSSLRPLPAATDDRLGSCRTTGEG